MCKIKKKLPTAIVMQFYLNFDENSGMENCGWAKIGGE